MRLFWGLFRDFGNIVTFWGDFFWLSGKFFETFWDFFDFLGLFWDSFGIFWDYFETVEVISKSGHYHFRSVLTSFQSARLSVD